MTNVHHAQFQEAAFWKRALFMLGFWLAYSITEVIIGLVVVVQFVIVLFTGRENDALLGFGNSLSLYVRQILQYVLFNSEHEPFPFSDFPDEPPEGNRWRGAEHDTRDDVTGAHANEHGTTDVAGMPDASADDDRPVQPRPEDPPLV